MLVDNKRGLKGRNHLTQKYTVILNFKLLFQNVSSVSHYFISYIKQISYWQKLDERNRIWVKCGNKAEKI